MEAKALDVCCASRMMWFDKNNQQVMFVDKRSESHTLCDGRVLEVKPDVVADFTNLPFADESFHLVVFDPPHLERVGAKGWQFLKYGKLDDGWQAELAAGFAECFRVLKPYGTLIFKWNETQIPVSKILALTPVKPLFGHRSGKASKTHWITFMKAQTVAREQEGNDGN